MKTHVDRWRSIVAGFESSGLTVAEYCHRRGVSAASFFRWRRMLRSRPAPTFVEATVRPSESPVRHTSPVVEVRRWRVVVPEGFDAATLGRLVATLELLDLQGIASAAEHRP